MVWYNKTIDPGVVKTPGTRLLIFKKNNTIFREIKKGITLFSLSLFCILLTPSTLEIDL